MQNHQLYQQILRLPLAERAALLVTLANNVSGEASQTLPPGPVAHCANLRHAAREVQRVLRINYGEEVPAH